MMSTLLQAAVLPGLYRAPVQGSADGGPSLHARSAFGLKVLPAKAVFSALPPLFSAKLVQQRDAAKTIGVSPLP